MKKNKLIFLFFGMLCYASEPSFAQEVVAKDTSIEAKITIIKDARIDMLGQKQNELNIKNAANNSDYGLGAVIISRDLERVKTFVNMNINKTFI